MAVPEHSSLVVRGVTQRPRCVRVVRENCASRQEPYETCQQTQATAVQTVCDKRCHAQCGLPIDCSVSASERCKLSGAATALQSCAQTITPALSGALFAWALKSTSNTFPGGVNLNFFITSVILCLLCFAAYKLPRRLEKPFAKQHVEGAD